MKWLTRKLETRDKVLGLFFYAKNLHIATGREGTAKMAVTLTLDNSELARSYDDLSDSQFINGVALIEALEVKEDATVLDIGCGTGRLGRHVTGIIGPAGTYIGIDPLAERIRIANEKNYHENAFFEIGTAENLETIKSNSIDAVFLNAVFHWLQDKEAALREIVRVLKPGGKVGMTTGARELNFDSGIEFITNSVLQRSEYSKAVKLQEKKHLTTTELINLLVKVNLKVVDIQVKTVKRTHPTAKDFIRHIEASSFGNYLSNVPENLREQVKADIEIELEKYRTKDGIQLSRHTIFAIAKKKKGLAIVH